MDVLYNNIATHFSKTRFSHWTVVKDYLNNLEKNSFVADIGSGNGKYLNYRNDIFMIGNDVSINLALIAKKTSNEIILSSGLNLAYKDKCFDHSISIAVLHHIDNEIDRIKFIKELIRITKKTILISVWSLDAVKKKWELISGTDYHVPWNNKVNGTHFITNVYKRYYHLFTKEEIDNIMKNFNNSYDLIYDKENWFIIINNSC